MHTDVVKNKMLDILVNEKFGVTVAQEEVDQLAQAVDTIVSDTPVHAPRNLTHQNWNICLDGAQIEKF